MTTKQELKTTHLTPPGRILGEELLARGIKRAAFAAASGIPLTTLRAIIPGTGALTPEIAAALHASLGISDGIWTRLEETYRDRLAEQAASGIADQQ